MSEVPPASKPTSTPSLPAHLASDEARASHRMWIGGAIKTLLMIYDAFPSDPRVSGEIGRMWADDLEGFPQPVIEAAIDDYRRNETRKPVPAAILALCRRHMPKPKVVYTDIEDQRTPEERAAQRERVRQGIEEFLAPRRVARQGVANQP